MQLPIALIFVETMMTTGQHSCVITHIAHICTDLVPVFTTYSVNAVTKQQKSN